LVKYPVTEAARNLNLFPNKHGVSNYFSPRMILHQENIDYNCHFKLAIGDYVEVHDDKYHKSTTPPHTLDCLYIRPTSSKQEGNELLNFQACVFSINSIHHQPGACIGSP